MNYSDYENQLASVNRAISAIENGAQEYRLGTRMVKKAELSVLYQERIRLENICQGQNNSTVAVIMR